MEYLWMDVKDDEGNWIVNPVAPNKSSLVNINAERICQLTDLNGDTRQARGYAGFSFQGITSTADGMILMPTENVFDPTTRGALPPDPNSVAWNSLIEHCTYLKTDPETPFINSLEDLKKGLFSLGNIYRCISDADEFSSCGEHPGSLCMAYNLHGPMKLGYLYGWAGDYRFNLNGQLPQNLVLTSEGGCKMSFQGTDGVSATLPYSPGFTQYDSLMPIDNQISQSVPSESFIVLDGARAIRIRLNTWFAVLSDPAYKNFFALLDTYIAADTNIFVDNPYIEGEDYSAGLQWYSFTEQGEIVWGSAIQHIGGFSYWTTKKFCEEQSPPVDYTVLDVLAKVYHCLPPDTNGNYPPDPTPDPWASEYTPAVTGDTRGTRMPDEVIWQSMGKITTVVSTGDPLFAVDPEYSENQGYTLQFGVTLPNIIYIHLSYYYQGVMVGQKYVQNYSPRSGYSPSDILTNSYILEGCQFNSTAYPSSANFNMFPAGSLGDKCFAPLHTVVISRNGLELTFQIVLPRNWGDCLITFGDGSPQQTVNEGTSVTHAYDQAGTYLVTIVNDNNGFSSSTYYEVTE